MARETSYFVQAFNAGKGGNLKADTAIVCKSGRGAIRTAERLGLSRLGVSRSRPPAIPKWVTMTTSLQSFSGRGGFRLPSTELVAAVDESIDREFR